MPGPADEARWITVGRIGAPQGVKGAVRLWPETDFPERLAERRHYWLLTEDGRRERRQVAEIRPRGRFWLIRFTGMADRQAAEQLRHALVQVPAGELPPLPEGEFYHHQLLGLTVVTTGGEELGSLREILSYGAADVLVVAGPDSGEKLLPATREVVREVDLTNGLLKVQVPPGLLD